LQNKIGEVRSLPICLACRSDLDGPTAQINRRCGVIDNLDKVVLQRRANVTATAVNLADDD
jgi:hypothetical protein